MCRFSLQSEYEKDTTTNATTTESSLGGAGEGAGGCSSEPSAVPPRDQIF